MAYPSVVTTYTNPLPTDRLNSPSHSSVETAQNTGLTELMTFVGTLASAAGTIIYDVRAAASNGGGHVQTANKGGTGQTSFTKGDLLIAQSSSVLVKLAVSSIQGAVPQADTNAAAGISWSANPLQPLNVQSFLSSGVGVWTKPANAQLVFVQGWGGGGGGGGVANSQVSGGGGGGSYKDGWFLASVLTSSVLTVVGHGGAGGAAGTNVGSAGGSTLLGTYFTANPGLGGGAGGTTSAGGNGGAYSGIDRGAGVNSSAGGQATKGGGGGGGSDGTGQAGGDTVYGGGGGGGGTTLGTGGAGGGSDYGGSGAVGGNNAAGTNASTLSGGGGGAGSNASGSKAGGSGFAGKLIIATF